MTYDHATITFADGYTITIPLVTATVGDRSWRAMCVAACAYVQVNTGNRYLPQDVVSVKIREGAGG